MCALKGAGHRHVGEGQNGTSIVFQIFVFLLSTGRPGQQQHFAMLPDIVTAEIFLVILLSADCGLVFLLLCEKYVHALIRHRPRIASVDRNPRHDHATVVAFSSAGTSEKLT